MTFDEALRRLQTEWSYGPFHLARICVEISQGNFIAGHILMQILYWNMPGKKAEYKTKLRVVKRSKVDGETYLYLAKSHKGFALELGVTQRELRTSLDILEGVVDRVPSKTPKPGAKYQKKDKILHPDEQVIIAEVFRFNSKPTRHFRINWDVFFQKYDEAKEDYRKKVEDAKNAGEQTITQEYEDDFYQWGDQ